MHSWGPQPLSRTQRLAIAHEIAEQIKKRFALEVFAIQTNNSFCKVICKDTSMSYLRAFKHTRDPHHAHCGTMGVNFTKYFHK